jgi:CheY-like chemotaxis protein
MTRILVVDDETALRELVADVLTDAGYVVSTASNGDQAIAALQSTRPDVVLLDLVMPGMNGWEFLETCRATSASRGLPIVIMSGARDAQRAIATSTIVRLISKPFDLEELLATIQELVPHSVVHYSTLHPDVPRRRTPVNLATAV